VGRDVPALALPLRFLAGAVAYSRVHTGVHYPSDALIGSIIGAGVADILRFPWRARRVVPSRERGQAGCPAGR
jgi:membrane-associated phospholipid phosphatase